MLRSTVPLLAVLVLAACGSSGSDDRDLPPLRVVVAGDSLAGGFYADDVAGGFATLVVEGLGEDHEVTPVTVAVPGARATGLAVELERGAAGDAPADVVVLEIGGNDVGESSLRRWTAGYRRLLDAVVATSPEAEVVCLGPWGPPRAARPYEAVVRRLCADRVYVRLSDLYATPGLRGPVGSRTALGRRDSFHPNAAGHAAIADRVRGAL